MGKPKVLFVINPISGKKSNAHIISFIKNLNGSYMNFEVEHFVWQEVEQQKEICEQIASGSYNRVVVVGGDGTLNMVCKVLVNSETKLAIIPRGSGNGLARHLKIPLKFEDAFQLAMGDNTSIIDVGKVNNNYFFCTTGLGFDAIVANEFALAKHKRGFGSYIKKSVKAYFLSRSSRFEIEFKNRKIITNAFLVTLANTNQYGNNAYIAPKAKINDGKLSLVIIKPIPLYAVLFTTIKLFNKRIASSKYVQIIEGNQFSIYRENHGPYHFDGEVKMGSTRYQVSVCPNAVSVVIAT